MFNILINLSKISINNFTDPPTCVKWEAKSPITTWDLHFLNFAWSSGMKKTTSNIPESQDVSANETVDTPKLSDLTEPLVSARLRNPKRPDPISHVFAILPDADKESLLCHACETLASLNVMSTDLACDLEGSRRNVALAIQQLATLAELLVNRALDLLELPEGSRETPTPSHH